MSPRRISARKFRWLTGKKAGKIIDLVVRRPSLLLADFDELRNKRLAELGLAQN